MPSCKIFLGIGSTFWDTDENLLLDATKFPRSLWIFSGCSRYFPFLVCPVRFSWYFGDLMICSGSHLVKVKKRQTAEIGLCQ